MFPNSTILGPTFWIVMGLLYAFVIVGAIIWAQDLKLNMPWWKWLLSALWFMLLNITVAGGFTLIGERENRAGFYMMGVFGFVTILLGVGLVRLLMAGRKKVEPTNE